MRSFRQELWAAYDDVGWRWIYDVSQLHRDDRNMH